MSVGVSTWIIIGEKSIEPNLSALREKQNLTMAGSLGLRAEDGSRYSDTYRLQEGAVTYVDGGFVTMTNPDGGAVTGKWVFTADRGETATHTFTPVSVSGLTQYGTGTAYADRYQILGAISATFIPDNIADYNEYTTTITNQHIYPVARIGTTAYGSIEKALSVVNNGTVYALPGANGIISTSCAVPSGSTLTLHIDDANGTYGSVNENNIRNIEHRTKVESGLSAAQYGALRYGATKYDNFKTFADTDVNNLVNEVTIAEGVTLTVNGTLNIGGIVGKVGQDLMGQTSGYYAQITMEDNAKIISNNVIDCFGFIKEKTSDNGSRVLVQSGTVYQPFVIYDYRGGNCSAGSYINTSDISVMPFSQYDLPNIQSIMEVKSTANIVGYADLHTGRFEKDHALFVDGPVVVEARHNCADIKVISGDDSIIRLDSGSYIISKYNPVDTLTAEAGTTTLDIYGGASNGTMALTAYIGIDTKVGYSFITVPLVIDKVDINTAEVYFAIPWKYDIRLNAGSYNFVNKLKLMTGAKLTVGSDATLNVNGELIIYETFTDNCTINKYPVKDPAQFIVDGTVNVSGALAGEIQPGKNEAILNLKSAGLSLSSNEGWGAFDMSGLGLNMDTINVLTSGDYSILFKFTHATGSPITEVASGDYYSNGTTTANATLGNSYYESNGTAWTILENPQFYTVNLHYDGSYSDSNANRSYNSILRDGVTSVAVKDLVIADPPAIEHYEFGGWYTNSACTAPIANSTTTLASGGSVALYAKWTAIQYNVEFLLSTDNGESWATIADVYKPINFTINLAGNKFVVNGVEKDTLETVTTDYNGLKFFGWYDSEIGTDTITTIGIDQFEDLLSASENNVITLYAKLRKMYTITLSSGANPSNVTFDPIYVPQGLSIVESGEVLPTTSVADTDPSKSHYFSGQWYTNSACTTLVDTSTPITANTTLYAKWIPKAIVITYQYSANNVIAKQYLNAGESVTLNDGSTVTKAAEYKAGTPPTYVTYAFKNWKSADGTITKEGGVAYTPTQSITFVPEFTPTTVNCYKVTVVSKGYNFFGQKWPTISSIKGEMVDTSANITTSIASYSNGAQKEFYVAPNAVMSFTVSADTIATNNGTFSNGSASIEDPSGAQTITIIGDTTITVTRSMF